MSQNHDYTAGEPIPVEDLVIQGDATVEHSADEAESNNVVGTLPPGNYLLRVAGFGKDAKPVQKTTFINGQKVAYVATQISVRLVDEANTGSIWQNLLLPPADKTHLHYYNHGKNANGKAEGFLASVFFHFVGRIIPGSAEKGKPLGPVARNLKNWLNKKVWATIEMDKGGFVRDGIDEKTGLPYAPTEPRPVVKMFSFREHREGEPCPLPAVAGAQGSQATQAKGQSHTQARQPAMAGASVNGSVNGYHDPAADDDDGMGNI